jgi:hypothetical protein
VGRFVLDKLDIALSTSFAAALPNGGKSDI